MPDFKTPNLCGANEEFNNLVSTFDSLENDLMNGLETAASELSTTLGTGLDSLVSDMSSFGVPEIPSIPNVNLQSQLTSLASIDISSLQGLTEYNTLLADITTSFDTELAAAGYSLDDLVSKASSLISGGDGLCGSIPNFSKPTDGEATEIADAIGHAAKKIETEAPPVIETAKKLIAEANTKLKANNEIAAASSKKWIQQITQSMPVGAGEISTEAEEECTKADTIVKANVPPSPAVQRVQNTETQAAETKKPDTPATAEERALSGDYTLEDTFITEYLKKENNLYWDVKASLVLLVDITNKSIKDYPHNITELGTHIYVSYKPAGTGPKTPQPSGPWDGHTAKYSLDWSGYKLYAHKMNETMTKAYDFLTLLVPTYQKASRRNWENVQVRIGGRFHTDPEVSKGFYQSRINKRFDNIKPKLEKMKVQMDARIEQFKATFIADLPKGWENDTIEPSDRPGPSWGSDGKNDFIVPDSYLEGDE